MILRANSRLREYFGDDGLEFIEYALKALTRILPHVEVAKWKEDGAEEPVTVWTSSKRKEIRITLAANWRSLTTTVKRRQLPATGSIAKRTLDSREYDICKSIQIRTSEILKSKPTSIGETTFRAISRTFDENIVARHLETHLGLSLSVSSIFSELHKLSEQTYENKSLTFGCILEPRPNGSDKGSFPDHFLRTKKYKALSDGFRTVYRISPSGNVLGFIDLPDQYTPLTEKHYFPEWAKFLASASRSGRCGIALSRQGDILVFDNGTLRFTYRYGRWQYWNHSHIVNLLRDRAKAQRVPKNVLGSVVNTIYRAALDISFRRSGGLFVVLHNKNDLGGLAKSADRLGDAHRPESDREFDTILRKHKAQSLARAVLVELASLDGAVVLANSGLILAYGAVLQPKKAGNLKGTEGSRTKAAIGASNYGLAIKISSDGGITVYFEGKEFLNI